MKNKPTVNFMYALAMFFYIDLTATIALCMVNEHHERIQMQQAAHDILNTPNLTQMYLSNNSNCSKTICNIPHTRSSKQSKE